MAPYCRKSGTVRLRTYFVCLNLLLFVSGSAAQYRIDHFSTDAGLPYKTVRSVLQTRDGYLWAATTDGLARFDGVRFTVFNTANAPELKTNRLNFLAETVDGGLWISGEEEGLFRLHAGKFTSFTTENGLPNNRILSLYADKESNRLQILTQKGRAVWHDGQLTAEHWPELRHEYSSLFDNTGAFCVIENGVVRRFSDSGGVEYKLTEASPTTILTQVYHDKKGAVWIGTFDTKEPVVAKLYIFNAGKTSVFGRSSGLPDAFIEQILEDRNGNIWVAAGKFRHGGLLKFENGKLRLFTKADGFIGSGVYGLTEDSDGGVWAATSDNGLARISKQFITSFTKENSGLTTNNVYPLYEDPEGNIWAGAWRYGSELNGGVDKFENGRFTRFATKGQITSRLPISIFKDREGSLWIGALDGVTRFRDGKFTRFTADKGIPNSEVGAITQTRDGVLWFGTVHGLIKFGGEVFTYFSTNDGLPHFNVRCLFESRDGTLWIGTRFGLGTYRDGKFTNTTEFPAVQIRSIYEDADGTIWFGTYDAGIFRFKNGEFKPITFNDGLFDQGAFQILEDDFGRFWISCNRGIYRVLRKEMNDFADGKIQSVTSVAYGVKDGMADAETNGGASPAGFRSRKDGTLWFPTQKGVVVIDTRAVPVNALAPKVAIEECLLDRKRVACDEITVSPDNETLEINYTGLSFDKPEQIRFRYKLDGLDENWNDAGTRRSAYFTHLPPGDYSFQIAAANSDGVWSETGTGLSLRVLPPVYRTWWFSLLTLLLFGGILYAIYRSRTNQLKKRASEQQAFSRQLLESQEQERQRIAAELHDSLGQDLLIIKNWATTGLNDANGSPKAVQQLTEISVTASEAIEEVREIAYNLRPYHLDELGLTKAIESMCSRVSRASQIAIECRTAELDGWFPKAEEINFYRIVQECLNNIVKHSKATRAKVTIDRNSHGLLLVIEDNGTGFDIQKAKAVMQNGQRRSLGLVSLIERSRILGGTPVIESIPGSGTKITLQLSDS